jgi:hypothetical protein
MKTWMKVVVCVGLAAGVVGATLFWVSHGTETLKARNPDIQTTKSKFDYITSKKFENLPASEKVKYVKGANPRELFGKDAKLSDDEKKTLLTAVRPVFRSMRKKQVNKYLELQTQSEKTAYLDEMIDERIERWKLRESATGVKKGKWKKPSLAKIKERIETTDPKERAKWMEFRMAIRQRMKERKVTPPWAR